MRTSVTPSSDGTSNVGSGTLLVRHSNRHGIKSSAGLMKVAVLRDVLQKFVRSWASLPVKKLGYSLACRV